VIALTSLLGVAAETETTGDPGDALGIGAVALILAASAVLIWAGYLIFGARRRRRAEETPVNLQPYLSDDELENKRLTRVLGWAVVVAAILAIILPVYYINESKRQATAAEKFVELDIHEGERWYSFFVCVDCHGPTGGGGSTEFVEERSGLTSNWSVPSLNDVFFRYELDEVEAVEIFGRQGTPMPGNGLDGGGAMTFQEIEQVMAYIRSLQITQEEVLAKVDPAVAATLARIESGETVVAGLIVTQEAEILDVEDAPGIFEAIATMPTEVRALISADGTCTDASAHLIGTFCDVPGTDTDRDGLSDVAEVTLSGPAFAGVIDSTILVRVVTAETVDVDGDGIDDETVFVVELVQDADEPMLYNLALDPDDRFSQTDPTGEPLEDLGRFDAWLRALDTAHLRYSVLTERNEVFEANAKEGLDFLRKSARNQGWIPNGVEVTEAGLDFSGVATTMGVSEEEAARAVGLFNSFCARCHTAGYSAGAAFELQPGTGAWGPSLVEGRSIVQFPAEEDQIDFIISGSAASEAYGINGLGTGRMPSFGASLTLADIMLIAKYERTL
jgi:mono/diheme cytochrome c family protein